MEANMQVLEGAQYRLRVKLTNVAGEKLPPELFRVYAGAFCPGYAPAHFHAERTAEEWLLTMPGLKPGRVPWNWQVIAAEYATGVEWLLAAGEVTVTPRHATGSGCVDPGELKIVATLDKTTLQMTVQVGESTAACSLAVVDARNSAKEADASAQTAGEKATEAGEHAAAAGKAAQTASEKATEAGEHAAAAGKAAQTAGEKATEAGEHAAAAGKAAQTAGEKATEAAGHATAAAKSAQDALANQQGAAQAARDAAQAQFGATAAKNDAAAAKLAAQTSERNAKASEDATAADRTAAEKAKTAALAAQSKAEQEAQKAEQNAALLGDAALQGGDNVFSGNNTFNGDIIGGEMQLPANSLAAVYYAALNWWNNEFDWYKEYSWDNYALSVFPNLTHFLPGTKEPDWTRLQKVSGYLTDCPLKAIPEGWTGAGLTRKGNSSDGSTWGGPFFSGEYLPDSWLTPDLVHANGMYRSSSFETLPEGTTFENVLWVNECFEQNGQLRYLPESIQLQHAEKVNKVFRGCVKLERVPASLTLEKVVDASFILYGCKKITQANYIGGEKVFSWWGSFTNCSLLRELHNIDCSSAVSCDYAWDGCQLDKASALRILSSLPAWSDEDYTVEQWVAGQARVLHIGIHRDLKSDADIIAALELAALPKADGGKGWRVSYAWNGTAGELIPAAETASTFGMRDVIYARLREQDGERVLEWAHGVLDPDGRSPEDLGYEEFATLDEALEQWGLREYQPEEAIDD